MNAALSGTYALYRNPVEVRILLKAHKCPSGLHCSYTGVASACMVSSSALIASINPPVEPAV